MAEFDLVIFDFDGVVVDSEILACGCLLALLRRHEIELDLAEVYERFLGRSFQAVADQYQIWRSQPVPADFRATLEAEIRRVFTASLRAMPGIVELLRSLKVPYCLASSSDPERVRLSLSLAKLEPYFEGRVFTAQQVRQGKPAPDLFLHAAMVMGVAPEHCLVIEDSVSGVAAAHAAGMTVWGFIGGSHYRDREGRALLGASGAVAVFDKMADLKLRLLG
ncbi:MAG TPA: HAD family hydrolase [Candidatus Cybelea sp.]|nr:HAD family hydrolase [Candidatus Cybelea sp.]